MDTRTRFFVFEGEFFRLCGVFYVLRCFFLCFDFFCRARELCFGHSWAGDDERRSCFLI